MTTVTETALQEMDIDESAVFGQHYTAGPSGLGEHHPDDFFNEKDTLDLQPTSHKEALQELSVKIHIRRAGRDSWSYLGRAYVSQEMAGPNSRVVVRSATSGNIMATFSEMTDLQAEKRGNFVVISCVESSGIVSWSLNAVNDVETARLLKCIELACYRVRQSLADPKHHVKLRRRIERMIKDDRRRRHKRRRDEEAMIEAFGKQQIL